jgi:hypothetical protein
VALPCDVPIFLVELHRAGPSWDPRLPLEKQTGFAAHAEVMDALVQEGFIVLGGPLGDEFRVMLAVEAETEDEVHQVLKRDPWLDTHLLIHAVDAWTIRLDRRNA